jgi:8-oxo-dGTP pyrophosphatase MutT (NUDIX family)
MNVHWKHFDRPLPYVTVCPIPFDASRRFPILWRTDRVRSAKNRWSLPTGMHEVGRSLGEQACVELQEELGLTGKPATWKFVTMYENVLPEDGYHWVILMGLVQVASLGDLQNKEPEKHSKVDFVDPFDAGVEAKLAALSMDAPMKRALLDFLPVIRQHMATVFPR